MLKVTKITPLTRGLNVFHQHERHCKGVPTWQKWLSRNSSAIQTADQIIIFSNKANNVACFCDKPSIWEQNVILLFLCSTAGWHIKEAFDTTCQWAYPPVPWSNSVFQSRDDKGFKKISLQLWHYTWILWKPRCPGYQLVLKRSMH